jgi:UDP-N-acetylmuramoyl-tripeptide--D-alanyl-D-alanine ligase
VLTGEKSFAGIFVQRLRSSWKRAKDRGRTLAGQCLQFACLTAALPYRALLRRVVFIGVTGSCGKTTTKELIAAMLATQFPGEKSLRNDNLPHNLASTVLRVRPWQKFCVVEIAAAIRGQRLPLERSLRVVQPIIGVVTNIGGDHLGAFQTLEDIAAEKGKLIAALPPDGTAVLNADDMRVREMQGRFTGRVITYGLASDALLRAENVTAIWPERLSFTVRYDGQVQEVQTQLCGAHWVPCALAALAVGLAMGIPLAAAAQAISKVPPVASRMSPVDRVKDIAFIRDDFKAPLWSIAPALAFMKDAKAKRKIVVIGTLSDYSGNSRTRYGSVAREALSVVDHLVFVGPNASKCLRVTDGPNIPLRAFNSVEAAHEYVRDLLRVGDLVLLKGTYRDKLAKLVSAAEAACVTRSAALPERANDADRQGEMSPEMSAAGTVPPVQVLVGLGNAGSEYKLTPHNVGHSVLDLLALQLGGEWVQSHEAQMATIEWHGKAIQLIKPLTLINESGPVLSKLFRRLGLGPAECVLVHDDIDLPLGTVRMRPKGTDGGHRGVRSIIQAFGTDDIRRLKIGVGRAKRDGQLLVPFLPAELPAIEKACEDAARRALDMVASGRAA